MAGDRTATNPAEVSISSHSRDLANVVALYLKEDLSVAGAASKVHMRQRERWCGDRVRR